MEVQELSERRARARRVPLTARAGLAPADATSAASVALLQHLLVAQVDPRGDSRHHSGG